MLFADGAPERAGLICKIQSIVSQNPCDELIKFGCVQKAVLELESNGIGAGRKFQRLGRAIESLAALRRSSDVPPAGCDESVLAWQAWLATDGLVSGSASARLRRDFEGEYPPGSLHISKRWSVRAVFTRLVGAATGGRGERSLRAIPLERAGSIRLSIARIGTRRRQEFNQRALREAIVLLDLAEIDVSRGQELTKLAVEMLGKLSIFFHACALMPSGSEVSEAEFVENSLVALDFVIFEASKLLRRSVTDEFIGNVVEFTPADLESS